MKYLRRFGMYLSLLIINTAHVARYTIGMLRGETESHGVRVLLIDERRVLLVSHWYAPWAWTLPGGGVNKNETPEDAAMREAFEETGLKVNSIAGEIGTYTGTMGKSDRVTFFIRAILAAILPCDRIWKLWRAVGSTWIRFPTTFLRETGDESRRIAMAFATKQVSGK